MLRVIAQIIAHPKYNGLIELTSQCILIKNQHFFLWRVLPIFTGKSISKNVFVKQMNLQGLQLVKQESRVGGKSSQKVLRFRVVHGQDLAEDLQKVLLARLQKDKQGQRLKSTFSNLCNKFHNIQAHSPNIMQELELIEQVSSLKQINMNIFRLNSEIRQLLSAFEEPFGKINDQDTFDLLGEQDQVRVRPYKFYSMQVLENCQ